MGELPGQRGDQCGCYEITRGLDPLFRVPTVGIDREYGAHFGFGSLHMLHLALDGGRFDAERTRVISDVAAQIDGWYFTGFSGFNGGENGLLYFELT